VTGGIEGKLKTAFEIAKEMKIPVYIVQVGTEHARKAMSGDVPDVGTIIRHC
jgi:isopentenyl phosphate kinase